MLSARFVRRGLALAAGMALIPVPAAPAQTHLGAFVASNGAANHKFGAAVSMSGDLAAVGAPEYDIPAGNSNVGSVYVYRRISGDTWGDERIIVPPTLDRNTGDQFGYSVGLSGDTLVVGAPFDMTSQAEQGAIYIYQRNPGTGLWDAGIKLTNPDAQGVQLQERFGWSVAIDGDTLVVGAPDRDVAGVNGSGRAYVFARVSGSWSFQAILDTQTLTNAGQFGYSVSISGDNILVGARTAENGNKGAAYFFNRSGGSWSMRQQVLPTSAQLFQQFGAATAISGDQAWVAAPRDTAPFTQSGAIRPFSLGGGLWTGGANLAPPGAASSDQYGYAVAMAGTNAVAGVPGRSTSTGRAFLQQLSGGAWSFIEVVNPDPQTGDQFGFAVGVSGSYFFIGAPGDASNRGKIHAFKVSGPCDGQTFAINSRTPTSGPSTGGTVITVNGAGLNPGLTVTFQRGLFSYTVPATFVSCTQLQVTAPAFPPPCDCATAPNFTVDMIFNSGGVIITRTAWFTYNSTTATVSPGQLIQPVINAAADGTCIVINPGIYQENNITLDDDDDKLTIVSTDLLRPQLTRIRGGSSLSPPNPTFLFTGAVTDSSLCGLNIVLGNSGVAVTNGAKAYLIMDRIENNIRTGNGGGVRVNGLGSNAVIDQCAVVLNRATAAGGGLAVENSGSLALTNSRITTNLAGSGGGGMYLNNGSAYVATNDFLDNDSTAGNGGGLSLNEPTGGLTIVNNRIALNFCGGSGGGVALAEADEPGPLFLITVNDISDNLCNGQGAGVHLAGETKANLTYNRIYNNNGAADGPGVYCFDTTDPLIKNNLIQLNRALVCGSRGGGIFIGQFNLAEVRDNIIKENEVQRGGGLICLTKSEPYLYRNIFSGNRNGQYCSPVPGPAYGPGVLVGDEGLIVGPAPIIISNSFAFNTSLAVVAAPYTGSIHGIRIGLFQPDWISNVIADGTGTRWGITTDDARNTGVRIDYNLWKNAFTGGSSDEMDPFIHINGQQPFTHNAQGNPMFRNTANCDYTPNIGSPARTSALGGGFGGAVRPDRVLSFTGVPITVEDVSNPLISSDEEERLASGTTITFPNASMSGGTEIYVQLVHYARLFRTDVDDTPAQLFGTLPAATLYAYALPVANPPPSGTVGGGGATLKLPLRVPLAPGTALRLYRVGTSVSLVDETGVVVEPFLDANINGTVDSTGLAATFSGVTQLLTGAGGAPWVYVGTELGPDCNLNGVPDSIEIQLNPALDANGNGIIDACEAVACLADFDGDELVGLSDLAMMIADFDLPEADASQLRACDLDGDGRVDLTDLAILIIHWGPCRPEEPKIPADPL